MRQKRYFYSLISSLCAQIVSVICGIILPRILIQQYGSELYGATRSITQFLGYIALMEGGVGGVARAALYKPLADRDSKEISKIVSYIRSFFRKIALFFSASAIVIAGTYKWIAWGNTLDWIYSFFLVIVIALSSMAEYYFGSAYILLLNADQKKYVQLVLDTSAAIVNTAVSCVLAYAGIDMIFLKLAWCGIHIIRIIILNWYIGKTYHLKEIKTTEDCLPQKWDGLGQHIAYFLQTNTDIMILTIFIGLSEVSVYSIYNSIIACLSALVLTLNANLEAIFGNMLARKELQTLQDFFYRINFIISCAVSICFSAATSMIIPFVRLYTSGIHDADYIRPGIAGFMLLTQMIYCLKHPYHVMTIAAGHFKETKKAAFIEVGLNIGLSILFLLIWGTEGVVLATLIALVYRAFYFVIYLKNHILFCPVIHFTKRLFFTIAIIILNTQIYDMLSGIVQLHSESFLEWIFSAVISVISATATTLTFSFIFYREDLNYFLEKIKIKRDYFF